MSRGHANVASEERSAQLDSAPDALTRRFGLGDGAPAASTVVGVTDSDGAGGRAMEWEYLLLTATVLGRQSVTGG